ncbi:MAG: hypothetical protein Kow00121_64510 [Elainellaceae cyanobacterium]
MQSNIVVGNALTDGKEYRGWFMGHFVSPEADPRSTSAIEVKWVCHQQGDRRDTWTTGTKATSLSILVSGRFRLDFAERSVLLAQQGDYVLWTPRVEHSWEAEADSVILTVRFPSEP